MPDEQQTAIGRDGPELIKRSVRIEPAGQRRMGLQSLALARAPPLSGQLGGLARPRLGAEQHHLEVGLKPCQSDTS
jgi:hypothetical protein